MLTWSRAVTPLLRSSRMGNSLLAALLVLVGSTRSAVAQNAAAHSSVIILGDGSPLLSADRSGTSIGILVRGTLYVFDAGPGVLRRLFEVARLRPDIQGLGPVFITHLHSDHTLGLPELLYYPHSEFLRVFGPPGTQTMMADIAAAWAEDREIRSHSSMPLDNALAARVNGAVAKEITGGVAYQDSNVKVTAFEVAHGDWRHALGYRVETPDRVITISGDTHPSEAVVDACNGCDVLLHAVYDGEASLSDGSLTYFRAYHTNAIELGVLAAKARPKLLVMYHQIFMGKQREDLIRQVATNFHGRVISAKDLDIY
jgi:ribonuclease BN (tRNA processing enzyme)